MTQADVAPPGTATGRPAGDQAPQWLQRIFFANLLAQTGIVLTGGLVRLTGSGLGCPTWPQCAPGSFVPTEHQAQSWHKYVEFGNRTLTFVLTALAIAAVVGVIKWNRERRTGGREPRQTVTRLAFVPLAGTFVQAILGGITVLTDLNPATVAAHFILSMFLIAGTLVLVWRAREDGDEPVVQHGPAAVQIMARALVGVGFVVLLMGTLVTGAGPHSGDAEHPARFNFDPAQMSWLHADIVMLFIGLTIGLLVVLTVTRAAPDATRAVVVLLAVSLAQGGVGYLQYFTGLPWLVVLGHLLGACLVWIAVLRIPLSLRSRGRVASSA